MVVLLLGGCTAAPENEIVVFVASSLTQSLTAIAEDYNKASPEVKIVFQFDSSGTLLTQIEQGAYCDVFLSASQEQMESLSIDPVILLENTLVLAVPQDNPAGILSFDDLSKDGVKLVAVGGADVPAGKYAKQVLAYLGLWDALEAAQKLTFSTSAKEIVTQISMGAVDCGIVYATDAAVAGLHVVAYAPEDSHDNIVYPAAVLPKSENKNEATAFVDYLLSSSATDRFEADGFIIPQR